MRNSSGAKPVHQPVQNRSPNTNPPRKISGEQKTVMIHHRRVACTSSRRRGDLLGFRSHVVVKSRFSGHDFTRAIIAFSLPVVMLPFCHIPASLSRGPGASLLPFRV